MIRMIILLAGLAIVGSCTRKEKIPEGILKPDKMQAVLWDVIKADVFTTDFIKKDTAKNAVAENLKLQQQIFGIHKISKADFYNSYDYYKSHTVVFKSIVDSMIAQAERKRILNTKSFNTKMLQTE
jgi:hypothetical protein